MTKATILKCIAFGVLAASPLRAETEDPVIKLGISRVNGPALNVEFQQYGLRQPLFKEHGIEASYIEQRLFSQPGKMTREQLDAFLSGFHVISLFVANEGVQTLTPELEAYGKVVGEALADYVKKGGGLYLTINPVRYPKHEDEKYWNIVFKPLGIQILREGVFDTTRSFKAAILSNGGMPQTFWHTGNLTDKDHPVLKGVEGLALPDEVWSSGVVALEYSDAWDIIVRGEPEAKSYRVREDNSFSTEEVGTYDSAPPVVAVRTLGKGRIFSFPLAQRFTGMNQGNRFWTHIVESRGNPEKNWPSDGTQLQFNAYKWLGEPALENEALGTYTNPKVAPIRYAESKSWDNAKFRSLPPKESAAKGIFGARSNFGGGQGTVAEYVEAAKAAGLQFIVFADPLENLTPESLEALKKACAEASEPGEFYAAPGIRFTDSSGIPWAMWGERIVYPDKEFVSPNSGKTYPLWDGERIHARGYYEKLCGGAGTAVLSYKQLRENDTHPENLWWFFHYFPRVYEDNKLVEDQYHEYLFGLRDLRRVALASFTGIDSPDKVKEAADLFVTRFPDLESAKTGLNSHFGRNILQGSSSVTEGPEILEWQSINEQMETNWEHTRGAQRVRLRFHVISDKGIEDIKVHDADQGVVRRFIGDGKKQMTEEFEMVHDKQHYLTLEVTDVEGQKAFSQLIRVYSYKQGLIRCNDNLNILGALGLQWHPDRNQFFDATRNFHNGYDFRVMGFDTSRPIMPLPKTSLLDTVNIEGVGPYPSPANAPGMTSKIMDVELTSTDVQIASMTLENLAERFDTDERTAPVNASSPLDVAENEYFRRTHRFISPRERIDWYIVWNHRRGREGRKDYRGSVSWHEGEIEFKKDVVLQGPVPIELLLARSPYNPEQGEGTVFAVAPKPGETQEIQLTPGDKQTFEGSITAGGFISQLATQVGYTAFFPANDESYTYRATFPNDPKEEGRIVIGMGHDGQEVKAGQVFKYRFAAVVFTDTEPNARLLEHTAEAMNFGGLQEGYPVHVEIGELKDRNFFLRVKAEDGEAKFSVGPEELIIDMPMVIEGIEDNGCAAVFTTRRPWFRFVSVSDGKAWFQEPLDEKNDIWVGNIFKADNKDIRITAVIDGQNRGRPPFLEVHNPTDKAINTVIRSPKHTPQFGGITTEVTVPEGQSIRLNVEDGALVLQE